MDVVQYCNDGYEGPRECVGLPVAVVFSVGSMCRTSFKTSVGTLVSISIRDLIKGNASASAARERHTIECIEDIQKRRLFYTTAW